MSDLRAGHTPLFSRLQFEPVVEADFDALKLHHLYLTPAAQGDGIGTWVLEQVKAEARTQGRDVKLEALKQSDANRFYLHHGFVQTGEEEFDLLYCWSAKPGAAA